MSILCPALVCLDKTRLIIRSCPKLSKKKKVVLSWNVLGALNPFHNHKFMWRSGLSAWILHECVVKSVGIPRNNVSRLLNNTCSRLSVGIPDEYVVMENIWILRDIVPILVNNCSPKWLHCALKPLTISRPYGIHTLSRVMENSC